MLVFLDYKKSGFNNFLALCPYMVHETRVDNCHREWCSKNCSYWVQ